MPASGWYEWPEPKQPRYFRRMGGATFAFAGLWESIRKPDGEDLVSCTIVMLPPNSYIAAYHDRAPMILTPELFDVWLAGSIEDADELAEPYDGDDLESWRVGPAVGN